MEKATKRALLHDGHLVLGMVLVMVAIVVIVRFPVRVATQTVAPTVAENEVSAVSVPFTKLARGSSSAVQTRANFLITSSTELRQLWELVDAKGRPPAVDFNTEAVIAVFAGEKPTTGYAIAVAKIEDSGARMVSVTLAQPESSCVTAQALTSPYEIVAIPATSLPLAHEDIATSAPCP